MSFIITQGLGSPLLVTQGFGGGGSSVPTIHACVHPNHYAVHTVCPSAYMRHTVNPNDYAQHTVAPAEEAC
jgi:hypothetical protein